MSEYQYYEFQAIDRPLTEEEQSYIATLSRRVILSPGRAIFTYSFGDFPGEPEEVLQNYFDIMLYMANWGTKQLAFRFPQSVVEIDMLTPFCLEDIISTYSADEYIVLDICVNEEGDTFWIEGEGWLSSLSLLRQDILRGDFRALYLAWLKAISLGQGVEDHDDLVEPPLPPNLKNLSLPLKKLVDFFRIDEDLIAAALELSPSDDGILEQKVEELVAKLSERERNEFLVKSAKGEPNVDAQLVRRLREISSGKLRTDPGSMPTQRKVSELFAAANEITTQRQKRQSQEAEQARIRRLNELSKQEPELWEEVFGLIEKKQSKSYDEAVKLLLELRELAEYKSEWEKFRTRIEQIYEQYDNRPGLKTRLRQAGLLIEPIQRKQ